MTDLKPVIYEAIHQCQCKSISLITSCRLHFFNTLKQDFNGTKLYDETSTDERTVIESHLNELPLKFSVGIKERQDKLPTIYLLVT